MKHMSFKNADSFKNLHDVMPFRPQEILIINGGILLPILLRIGKAFIRAKMMRRIRTVDASELKNLIEPEYLLDCYEGGSLKFDQEEWYQGAIKAERKERRRAKRARLQKEAEDAGVEYVPKKKKKEKKEQSSKAVETAGEPVAAK